MSDLSIRQKTIEREAVLEGVGIHTGKKAVLRLIPVPADNGVVFVRTDLPQRPQVKAEFSSLVHTSRRTALVSGGIRVETVEHFLAAMFALGIDNCLVEIDTAELPALDGSALPYYNLLVDSGVRELDAARREVEIAAPLQVGSEEACIRAFPADNRRNPADSVSPLYVSYHLEYLQVGLEQDVSFALDAGTFEREIAPARTFCLEEEIEQLQAAGFGKGANELNTVVLGPGGPRNELRFADEPARHKVLDVLGDLFFAGGQVTGRIECVRSGHVLNRELVQALLKPAT